MKTSAPLQGGVTKVDELIKATEKTELYKIAAQKLRDGARLSSEEYRSLGAGCIGIESHRTYFQKVAIVTAVYKDSPAEKAGLRKGDKLIDNDHEDNEAKSDPSVPRWKVVCGQAGASQEITILRHHKPVTVTLMRMNIEDIVEDKYRHEWERIVSMLGNPQRGNFTGKGENPPSSDQDPNPLSSDQDPNPLSSDQDPNP